MIFSIEIFCMEIKKYKFDIFYENFVNDYGICQFLSESEFKGFESVSFFEYF